MTYTRVANSSYNPQREIGRPSRREFLYYVWGASIALLIGEAAAGLAWFTSYRADLDHIISFPLNELPDRGLPVTVKPEQLNYWNGHLSLAHTDDDTLIALDHFCTHLHCVTKWVPPNHRYECPCHGAKFEIDGKYIEGPAPRSLGRYYMTIAFSDGTTAATNEAGDPIPLNGREIAGVTVDLRRRIERAGRV